MDQIMHVRRLIVGIIAAVLVSGGLIVTSPSTLAEETTCRGAIGAQTLDNVRVPSGSTCTLSGTYVQRTVKVEGGGTLVANGGNSSISNNGVGADIQVFSH